MRQRRLSSLSVYLWTYNTYKYKKNTKEQRHFSQENKKVVTRQGDLSWLDHEKYPRVIINKFFFDISWIDGIDDSQETDVHYRLEMIEPHWLSIILK